MMTAVGKNCVFPTVIRLILLDTEGVFCYNKMISCRQMAKEVSRRGV